MKLVDRRAEFGMLDRRVEAVCAGQSRALVLCGERGMGKTALLQHLIQWAAECRMVETAGVESKMELAFAGVHQLCAPVLRTVGELIANPNTAGQAVRNALLGLEVELPDDQAPARFGGENMKDVAGYDTKRLFIGGCGVFGGITTGIFKISVVAG